MTGGLLNRLTDATARRGTRPRGRVDAGRRGVAGPRVGRGRIRGRARLGAITGSRGRTLRIGGRRSPSTRRIHRGGRGLLRGDVARRDPIDTHTRRSTGDRRRIRLLGLPGRHMLRRRLRARGIRLLRLPRRHMLRRRPRARRIRLLRLPRRHMLRRRPRARRIRLLRLPRRHPVRPTPGESSAAGSGSAFFACPGGTPSDPRSDESSAAGSGSAFFACPGGTPSVPRSGDPSPFAAGAASADGRSAEPASPAEPLAPSPWPEPAFPLPGPASLLGPVALPDESGPAESLPDPPPESGVRADEPESPPDGPDELEPLFPLPLADASLEPPPDPCLDGVPVFAAEVSPADPLPLDDDGPRAARAGAAHIRALNSSAAIAKAARPTKDPRARSRRCPRGRDASAEPIAVSNCSLGRSLCARGPRPPTLRSRQLRKQSRFVPLQSVALDLGGRPWFRLG